MITNIKDLSMIIGKAAFNKIEGTLIEETLINTGMITEGEIMMEEIGIKTIHTIEVEVEIETSIGVLIREEILIIDVAVMVIIEDFNAIMIIEVIIEGIIIRGKAAILIIKKVALGKTTNKEEIDQDPQEIIKQVAIITKEDKTKEPPLIITEEMKGIITEVVVEEEMITIKEEISMEVIEMIIEVVSEVAVIEVATEEETVVVLIEAVSVVAVEAEVVSEVVAEVISMMKSPRKATTTKVKLWKLPCWLNSI